MTNSQFSNHCQAYSIVHLVTQWPSLSQVFTKSDILLSCSLFPKVRVFSLQLRVKSLKLIFGSRQAARDHLVETQSSDLHFSSDECYNSVESSTWNLLVSLIKLSSYNARTQLSLPFSISQSLGIFLATLLDRNLVIHAHFLTAKGMMSCIGCKLLRNALGLRTRIVVTAHAGDLLKMTHSHARQCIKETDCILAVSNAIKDRVSLVAKGHQCIVKYNSLDQAALNILAQKRSKMVSNADKSSIRVIQLVTVARLVPKKGLLNIVKAASNLKRSGIQFKWTLIGDGSQKEELLASISSNYLDNYVILAGSMLNTQALSFLISQDLFVGAFQDVGSDIDGLPHVLLEAAMAKLPIATTILAGISDLFDKSNCFVIQRSEPELIAMKIQEFLQSSQSDIEDKINRAHLTVSNVTSLSVQAMLLRKAYLIPFAHS